MIYFNVVSCICYVVFYNNVVHMYVTSHVGIKPCCFPFTIDSYFKLFYPDSSTAINGNATIRIFGLNCLEAYTVIAGGTLDGTLVGPRSTHDSITTGDCMERIAPTMSTMTSKNCRFNLQFIVYRTYFGVHILECYISLT